MVAAFSVIFMRPFRAFRCTNAEIQQILAEIVLFARIWTYF